VRFRDKWLPDHTPLGVSRQQVAVGGEAFHQGVNIGAVVVGIEPLSSRHETTTRRAARRSVMAAASFERIATCGPRRASSRGGGERAAGGGQTVHLAR
jgi:hypothetical protein